jgi:hypothetical protein
MRRAGRRIEQHASVPLRHVPAGEVRWENFLYELKAGPAGGRLRRPSSAGRHMADLMSAHRHAGHFMILLCQKSALLL